MEISPQQVRNAEFKTVRKGADPDEVSAFLGDVANELERAQNHATAMEARARAAVARLQEVGERGDAAAPATPAEPAAVSVPADEAETISRTLVLAQRTADAAVAEARAEAAKIVATANDEAAATRDSTREMAAQLIDEARTTARRAGENERLSVLGEVESLKARRDFLEADVEQLELFLTEQRSRIREAATSLHELVDRVPGGLGAARAPLLSAADDASDVAGAPSAVATAGVAEIEPDDEADLDATPLETTAPDALLIVPDLADDLPAGDVPADDSALDTALDPWDADAPTEALPAVDTASSNDDSDGFRFSFDDDRN